MKTNLTSIGTAAVTATMLLAGSAQAAGKPAPPKSSASKSSGSLAACCAALRQNAANAPEPNKGYMTYAAQLCDTAATMGKEKASIVANIQTALKGAGLPSACK